MSKAAAIIARAGGGRLVEVPEWGVTVLLRGISASLRLRILKDKRAGVDDPTGVMLEALRLGLRDPDAPGYPPIFQGDEVREFLDADQQGVTDRMLGLILEASGVTKDKQEEAKQSFLASQTSALSISSPERLWPKPLPSS